MDVKRGVFSEKVLKEWKGEHYYLVDIWQEQENYVDIANVNQAVQESFMNEALSKVSPWKDRVTVVRNYSVLASKLFPQSFSTSFISMLDTTMKGSKKTCMHGIQN